MNKKELQALAESRIKDAQVLNRAGRYDGADREIANKVFTHDLTKLLELAGLSEHFAKDLKHDAALMANWGIVTNWNERSRYQAHGREGKWEAGNMVSAITGPNGILECIKRYW